MLKYIGKGAFLPGVPDRDLTDEEVTRHGGEAGLLKSGLYEKPFDPSTKLRGAKAQDVPKLEPARSGQAKDEVKDA